MKRQRVPGQPSLLRELNDRSALELMLDEGALPRNELAVRTGLSKPTASEIIRRLESAHLIREGGEETGKRGPNAILYEAILEDTLAVAIDIQGTIVHSRVVSAGLKTYPTATHRMRGAEKTAPGVEVVRAAIDRALKAADADEDAIATACVAVQASVDPATDSLFFADTLVNWPQRDVSETLSRELGMHVVIENDANLAAVVERQDGVGQDAESFALVWLAEGVGMALDLNGELYRGNSGGAGEIGYLGLTREARELEPNGSSLADLACDDALIRLGITHGLLPEGSTDEDWHMLLETIPQLEERHPFMTDVAERIGYVITPVLAVTDPECVILHGPTGVAGGAALARATTSWLRRNTQWSAKILSPGVVDTPVLRGAVDLLVESLRQLLYSRVAEIGETAGHAGKERASAAR